MQSAKEAETIGDSTDNQSQYQRVKDKSLQSEEKLEDTTNNETGIRNKEATVEDTTTITNKAPLGALLVVYSQSYKDFLYFYICMKFSWNA